MVNIVYFFACYAQSFVIAFLIFFFLFFLLAATFKRTSKSYSCIFHHLMKYAGWPDQDEAIAIGATGKSFLQGYIDVYRQESL